MIYIYKFKNNAEVTFADDSAILVTGKDHEEATKKIEHV